jgi:hypothetical protein
MNETDMCIHTCIHKPRTQIAKEMLVDLEELQTLLKSELEKEQISVTDVDFEKTK